MVPNVKFEVLNVVITAFRRWRQHGTPKMLANFYETTRHYTPEEKSLL
jgi:hypothetical protein